ncbi:enoyl-CoA hydratase/isomerase family protein [Amorphus coralli]|uniref:enoyl-CoA hydratase/isomerase family protein n=1 Tax=Amorphus coralli TaxID=340680 RepID=UPI00037934F2|nr:enoyl-CoA hydratase/isomerase family protein [Amorphus coralli]
MSGTLDIRRDGQIALVTLSNPAKRNALSATMLDTLRTFAAEIASDRAVRAVIICGEGTTFSAGADIGGFDAPGGGSRAENYDPLLEDTLAALEALPQPTIAAIAGPCMGAGTALAAACDFRVAEESAFFAIPAARLGLGYDPKGVGRIVRTFGDPAARELFLLAERIPATRAHTLGAVHRLANEGGVMAVAEGLATVALTRAPLTIAAAKAALAETGGAYEPSPKVRALADAADASADYREGRAAFADKRSPVFTGR